MFDTVFTVENQARLDEIGKLGRDLYKKENQSLYDESLALGRAKYAHERFKKIKGTPAVELMKAAEEARKVFKAACRTHFDALLKWAFATHQGLDRLVWTQSTAYNDQGDEFSYHGLNMPEDRDEDDEEGGRGQACIGSKEDIRKIDQIFQIIPDDIFEAAFGDYACVTCTPDEVKITEYDRG